MTTPAVVAEAHALSNQGPNQSHIQDHAFPSATTLLLLLLPCPPVVSTGLQSRDKRMHTRIYIYLPDPHNQINVHSSHVCRHDPTKCKCPLSFQNTTSRLSQAGFVFHPQHLLHTSAGVDKSQNEKKQKTNGLHRTHRKITHRLTRHFFVSQGHCKSYHETRMVY